MDKLSKQDPLFYSKIANMRKVKSGGKFFKDTEAAKNAQKKAVEARLRNSQIRAQEKAIEDDTRTA